MCMWDYVGNDAVDPTLIVQNSCRKISTLEQVWNIGGRVCTDTPDELYTKFSRFFVYLPDKASSWSIQLCSYYLSSLTLQLSEAITSDTTFTMPDLATLTTKALQLVALRTVRSQAATYYKELKT